MMFISLLTFISIFEICSATQGLTPSASLNSTDSTITTVTENSCPCDDVHPSEHCLVEQMYKSVTFFREGTTKLVYQNVSATVKPVYENATLQTMSQFEMFNDKCLTETSESESDYLSINGSNKCSSSYRCCVMCSRCAQRRILNDIGPIILKSIIDVSDFKTSMFTLLMKCATNSPMTTAGHQFFSLRFSNRACTLNDSSTTLSGTESNTRKTTDDTKATLWSLSAKGSTVRYSTSLSGTVNSVLAIDSTVGDSSAAGSTVFSSAVGKFVSSWPATGTTLPFSSIIGKSLQSTSPVRNTAGSSLATSYRPMTTTEAHTTNIVLVSMSDMTESTMKHQAFSVFSSTQMGSDNLSTTTITMIHTTISSISIKGLKIHNAGHNLSAKTGTVVFFKLSLLLFLLLW